VKIVITGHCGGIGKEIHDLLKSKGHELIGFDIQRGDDLHDASVQQNLFLELVDADVFINNVYMPKMQTLFLKEAMILWKNSQKFIVNMASAMVYTHDNDLKGHTSAVVYKRNKTEQLEMSRSYDGMTKIMNIMPGWVNTDMGRGGIGSFHPGQEHTINTLTPKSIADMVAFQIDNIDNFHIKELLVEPA
jgi:NADP-dependent 3-hydroxy acid dehydrogenase YdfG